MKNECVCDWDERNANLVPMYQLVRAELLIELTNARIVPLTPTCERRQCTGLVENQLAGYRTAMSSYDMCGAQSCQEAGNGHTNSRCAWPFQ